MYCVALDLTLSGVRWSWKLAVPSYKPQSASSCWSGVIFKVVWSAVLKPLENLFTFLLKCYIKAFITNAICILTIEGRFLLNGNTFVKNMLLYDVQQSWVCGLPQRKKTDTFSTIAKQLICNPHVCQLCQYCIFLAHSNLHRIHHLTTTCSCRDSVVSALPKLQQFHPIRSPFFYRNYVLCQELWSSPPPK